MNLIPLLTLLTLTIHIQEKYRTLNGTEKIELATCTGVWISPKEVLTAGHCMENNTGKMWVLDSNYKSFSAMIERLDKKNDLCLLKITSPEHTYVKLGNPPVKREHICLISSEEDMIGTYAEGIVENIIQDPDTSTLSIIHSASILPGASGSGLFDSQGRLVGINTAMYKSLANAVDITEIQAFLYGKRR